MNRTIRKNRKTLPKLLPAGLPGAVCTQHNTGKDGIKRGPYYYRVWREDGKLRRVYVRKRDVARVRVACKVWQQERYNDRAFMREALRFSRMDVQQLIREIRKVEREIFAATRG